MMLFAPVRQQDLEIKRRFAPSGPRFRARSALRLGAVAPRRRLWTSSQGTLATLEKGWTRAGPFAPHLDERELVCAFPSNHDEVGTVRHESRPKPKALSADPLDPVAYDRVPDLPGRDNPEPRRQQRTALGALSCGDQKYEMTTGRAFAVRLHVDEVGPTAEPALFAEPEGHVRPRTLSPTS